jgi:hypothetical protein
VFILDKNRRLRYEGRLDNSHRIEKVKTHDATRAINAQLANKPVPVTEWRSAVPYTVRLGPSGEVLYSAFGSFDILQLRRKILPVVPSAYIGFNKYWTTE